MRELVLLAGLITLGYFTESSLGYVLRESCKAFEDHERTEEWQRAIAHASKASKQTAVKRLTRRPPRELVLRPEIQALVKTSGEPQVAESLISSPSDDHEVKLSQVSPEDSRAIR